MPEKEEEAVVLWKRAIVSSTKKTAANKG